MTRIRLNILRVTSLLGLLMSLYLVRQHVEFAVEGHLEQGLCSVAKVFDCAATEKSRFSSVAGIPTASFGVYYFLIMLGVLFCARRGAAPNSDAQKASNQIAEPTSQPQDQPAAEPATPPVIPSSSEKVRGDAFASILCLTTAAGLWVSVGLALVSALVVRGFCVGCTFIHILTLVNALVAMRGGPVEYLASAFAGFPVMARSLGELFGDVRSPDSDLSRKAVLWMVFLVAPLNFAAPPLLIHRNHTRNIVGAYARSPEYFLDTKQAPIAKGPLEAPLQIVVFTDFDCPYCRKYQPLLEKALSKYSENQYRLVYKLYPLGRCNPIMEGRKGEHKNACRLAEMAAALNGIGKFWEVGEQLYELEGRNEIQPGLKEISEKAGIKYLDWVVQEKDPRNRELVVRDINEGNKLGVTALPAIFVNARAVDSLRPDHLQMVLDYAIKKATEVGSK